ncbi:elongation of very long chain fatty acids protein AAEL008004-like [Toxorhynchites rutilus septentrionalis]|uniref:elongation of very long chain fatty acids protein AAEL008004-like n=1 Tax=Toxorhynchites rutilus septentrionalis TaxID=329112 RepID=UPI00247A7EAD|nr:elongation of very long chain fatty acids protein AAEL008004-like [Toxorhynchites rutilus septentrionalis]
MALVLKFIQETYKHYYEDAQDPRTKTLFLMNPPWVPLAVLVAYLYFVQNLGPKLMSHRKPFNLRYPLLTYNILQVLANIYLAYQGTVLAFRKPLSLRCDPVSYSNHDISMAELRLVHYYCLLKVADLADTIFFVLRKKQNQVSFLHVYHHTGILLSTFIYSRVYPGGHCALLGLVNTYVHAVMYFYFFLAVYRPELTKNTRCKKYITILQMAQFAAMIVHFGRPVLLGYECGIPHTWFWMGSLQNLFMLVMFADFYSKTYRARKVD